MGYWEPHTSSIDFCEDNYRFTSYVAELLNSVTSLPIAIVGAWAWALTPPVFRGRLRFALCWVGFIAVGLGSMAFHATLRRPAQAMDEVPMVLMNLVFVFCLNRPEGDRGVVLAASLSLVGAILVVVYAVFEFYGVFFVMYGAVVVYLAVHSGVISFSSTGGPNSFVLRWLWKVGFTFYVSGFCLWLTDNVVCSRLGVGHLHIAWHFLACMGTMLFVLLLIAATADQEGFSVTLQFHGGMLPYLVVTDLSSDPVNTKKVR